MRTRWVVAMLVVVLVAALACGDGDADGGTETAAVAPTSTPEPTATFTPTPTPTPTPSPTPSPTSTPTPVPVSAREVLEASLEAMDALSSFHFELEMVLSVESEDFALDIPIELSGDFQAPDRVRASVLLTLLFLTIETEVVSIGDTQYVKDPETGEWQVSVGQGGLFTDPGQFIQLTQDLRDLALVGLETLDGLEVRHLTARAVEGSYGGTGGEFQLSLWIRTDDALLARIVSEGETSLDTLGGDLLGDLGQGAAKVMITLNLSEFGKEVTIVAPVGLPTPTATPTTAPPAAAPEPEGEPAVADPDALVQRVNAAMNAVQSVHFEGEMSVRESQESEAALLSAEFEGNAIPGGDSRMVMNLKLDLGGFAGRFTFEARDVGGVSYTQDPFTNQWQIEEGGSSLSANIVAPGVVEVLSLEDITVVLDALDGLEVFRVTGSVPDDPEVDVMVLWVGIDDLLVRRAFLSGRAPVSEFGGLVPAEAGQVFMSFTMTYSRYGEPVAIEAPKVN